MRIQGKNPDGTRNPAYPVYVDVPNLIDYMILHISSGAEDWPDHNWWGARRRGPESTGFKFFVWDQEISNDSLIRQYTLFQTRFEDPAGSPSPSFLYGKLRDNPSFRDAFGDRVQALLWNGGTLSPEANAERWLARQTQIDQAIVGESARWGDSKKTPAYRREVEWRAEMDFERDQYWPGVRPLAIERFRRARVFPGIDAPTFRVNGGPQYGGFVDSGARLTMTSPVSTQRVETPLLEAAGEASAFVPSNDLLGTEWRSRQYVEGSKGETWKHGQNGVGYETTSGYETVIKIDVKAEMTVAPANNSVYVRLPFTIPDQAALDALEGVTLKMLYDDGFTAWLNGTLIASANAPAPLAWNSAASAGTEATLGSPAAYEVTNYRTILQPGLNVLAIHGLNSTPTSSDMLILPELWGWRSDTQQGPEIRFTLDGSDPKSPGALLYQGTLTVEDTVHLKARARGTTEWSALSETYFVVRDAIPLRLTEILYHPASSPELPYDEEDFEFLEFLNIGSEPVTLDGLRLEGGIDFDFTNSAVPELLPGEYLLVVKSLEAFHARYGESGFLIAGQYGRRL